MLHSEASAELFAGRLLAEREEVLGAFDGLADAAEEDLEVFAVFDEVDVGGVDHEEIAGRVVEEEMFVGFCDLFEVFVADGAFDGGVFAAEALFEDIERSLQVDDEVGSGQWGAEEFVVTVVDVEFFVAEVEVGEEFVFLEDVVGDYDFLRVAGGSQGEELFVTADEERELGLESGSGFAIVKGREERVVLRFLEELAVKLFGEEAGERAFADANGTFYGDITGWFEEVGHE
jgi:hypothetical protein